MTGRGRESANRNVRECPEAGPRGRRGSVTGRRRQRFPMRGRGMVVGQAWVGDGVLQAEVLKHKAEAWS